jgi:hypothetical protein
MKRIRSSLRRVSSRLQLDALEDRLLLSGVTTCPSSLVGDANLAAAQAVADSSSSPSDTTQTASTDCSGTTVCPQTGDTVNAPDLAASSVVTTTSDPASNPVAVASDPVSAQLPSAISITPNAISPDLLMLARAMDKTSLSGGEALGDHASALTPAEENPGSSYVAASALFVGTDEHDLSWVDDSAPKDRDQTAPPVLLAQADRSAGERTLTITTYQLAPDFQPLDKSSPFLVATLRSVAVQATKSDAPTAVASLSDSPGLQAQSEPTGIWDAPVSPSQEQPMLSRADDAAPDAIPETKADNAVPSAEEADGYLFGGSLHQVLQVAFPVAGAVLALSFYQAQWPREEQSAASGRRRNPVLVAN